jgi:hypothetical protein
MNPGLMRKLALMAIVAGGVFYAPLPLIAQNGGGGSVPLMPVEDIPTDDSGGVSAPSGPPLKVDPAEAPELVPPDQVSGEENGGTTAPAPSAPAPAPTATARVAVPAPVPAATAPEPTPAPAPAPPTDAAPAQAPEEPAPDEDPEEAPEPDEDETDPEEFEEEFDDVPEAGEPDSPAVQPRVTSAGPQLPQTGAELPALLLCGLSLTASGLALRALCRGA